MMGPDDGTPDEPDTLPWWEHAIAAFGAARKASQRSNDVVAAREARDHATAARKATQKMAGAFNDATPKKPASCCIANRKLK